MKKLLAALLMLPSLALAESWSIPNKNGGEIVITDRPCVVRGKNYENLREAYSHWNGGFMEGCWTITDGMARIVWLTGDGEVRLYELANFKQKQGGKKN